MHVQIPIKKMLIVNADDLGRSRDETDAVLTCHAQRRVTSTSAMVFMADSERAAQLARARGIPVGLHLNLSERFSADNVEAGLRHKHERLCRFLKSSKYSVVLYHPLLAREFADVVQAQLTEFGRLFGCTPAHVDGHQHMHLATNVLVQRLLPAGTRVRRSFSFAAGQKSLLNRCYRERVDSALARRHPLTDYFFSLGHHLNAQGIARLASLATRDVVELMVHPAWDREFDFMMGEHFTELPIPAPGQDAAASTTR